MAKKALKPGGRLIALDGCYIKGQSKFAHYLLEKDRGRYVRTKNGYLNIALKVFTKIKVHIRNDLFNIPYTHIIMELEA